MVQLTLACHDTASYENSYLITIYELAYPNTAKLILHYTYVRKYLMLNDDFFLLLFAPKSVGNVFHALNITRI